ncbi:MAG: winged helix DNA-binding protein [Pacificimonas sp.]|jgi:hypothetical protein|nr:winged helix DNA-binding protein [Pacificimonas sp.]
MTDNSMVYANHTQLGLIMTPDRAATARNWASMADVSVRAFDNWLSGRRDLPSAADADVLALDVGYIGIEALTTRLSAVGHQDGSRLVFILDEDCIDSGTVLLDIKGARFLYWPTDREDFVNSLSLPQSRDLAFEERAPFGTEELGDLKDQVEKIASALDYMMARGSNGAEPPRERSSSESAALIRDLIRQRRLRADFFPSDLFADPAWDILLDLAAARHEGTKVSVSSLCIAANVPTTTALRWIKALGDAGLLERQPDPGDGRRSFIALTERTAALMERYLDVAS